MSNIISISGIRGYIDENGVVQLNAEDVARGWGFVETKSGKQYVMWRRVNTYLQEFGFGTCAEESQLVGKGDFVPENMVYRLGFRANNETAQKFQTLLADEVLPTLRKTGTYSINPIPKEEAQLARAKAMELNARTRAAQMWLKIADTVNLPEYKQIASTYAANTLANKEILALPETPTKTYTATEIGNMFGVSANKIGKLANANGLKTKEYGKLFYDKSRYSCKEVESWRYYENAIPVLRRLLPPDIKPLEGMDGGVAQ